MRTWSVEVLTLFTGREELGWHGLNDQIVALFYHFMTSSRASSKLCTPSHPHAMIDMLCYAHLPTSHSLTPPFLTYATSNNPAPSATVASDAKAFCFRFFSFLRSLSPSLSSSLPLRFLRSSLRFRRSAFSSFCTPVSGEV